MADGGFRSGVGAGDLSESAGFCEWVASIPFTRDTSCAERLYPSMLWLARALRRCFSSRVEAFSVLLMVGAMFVRRGGMD